MKKFCLFLTFICLMLSCLTAGAVNEGMYCYLGESGVQRGVNSGNTDTSLRIVKSIPESAEHYYTSSETLAKQPAWNCESRSTTSCSEGKCSDGQTCKSYGLGCACK